MSVEAVCLAVYVARMCLCAVFCPAYCRDPKHWLLLACVLVGKRRRFYKLEVTSDLRGGNVRLKAFLDVIHRDDLGSLRSIKLCRNGVAMTGRNNFSTLNIEKLSLHQIYECLV